MLKILLLLSVFFVSVHLSAQNNSSNIPPVTAADFSPVSPLMTTESDAIILLDSGASTLDANPEDGFFINYYKFRRVLIRNKRSLESVAKNEVSFSAEMNAGKKLKTLKATTYNLENGQIVKTVLQDKDFFVAESKDDLKTEKFAFAEAKEGSIIEYEYSERWSTTDVENWYFQSDYPKIRSIYTVRLPDMFNFAIQFQSKKYLTKTESSTAVKNVYSSKFEYENTTIHTISWTYENVPSMKEEAFTSTVENYIACVKFQLSARPQQPGITLGLLRDWQSVSNQILNSEKFGIPIQSPSSLLKKQAIKISEGKSSDLQKARSIYAFVRDHFKVTRRGIFISDGLSLNDIYKAGIGEVGEINLVLIAMLRSQKIHADPVILATRDKGLTNQNYPILENFNYLVCRVVAEGQVYYLDASVSTIGFGKLPSGCYNGHARAITKENFPVFLEPDSLKESMLTVANINNDNSSKLLILEWTKQDGYYESSDLRDELKGKTIESVFKSSTQTIPFRKSLDTFFIGNLQNLDEPLILNYKMTLDPGSSSRLYFNPLLNSGLTENPFKSAVRSYPVEMPYVSNSTFTLNMEIPAGYEIDELLKSEKISLNESDGSYEYKIEQNGSKIQVKSTMILNKAIFEPEDYNSLKDFYATIIKKQSEMIVFKKKN